MCLFCKSYEKEKIMKKLVFVLMLLALLVTPSLALAEQPGYEVRGQGKVQFGGEDEFSVSHISVNAWLDGNGVAHGMLTWVGGVPPETVPPAFPWQMDVTSIVFSGNTATVCWVVVHSVVPGDIGVSDCFDFTDNRATGAPDEIDGVPLEAGNIIVR
jgi:hypothetical protein